MISGAQLRLIRKLHEIKQETIAKKIGISQPAYCKLEKKKEISAEKLQKIIEVLNCTKEELQQEIRSLPPPGNEQENKTAFRIFHFNGIKKARNTGVHSKLSQAGGDTRL